MDAGGSALTGYQDPTLLRNDGNVLNIGWVDGHATSAPGSDMDLSGYSSTFWTGN